MNHYDDTPDTTRFYSPIPAGPGPGISSTRCGCVLPASCGSCRGDWIGDPASAGRKWRLGEVRKQWWAGQLTAREYYHLTASLSYDGFPDDAAVRAVAASAALHGEDDGRGVA